MQHVSFTELAQKWGKAGKEFSQQFSAVNAIDLCHTRIKVQLKEDAISSSTEDVIFKELLAAKPNCELSKFFYGLRSSGETCLAVEEEDKTDDFYRFITNTDGLKEFVPVMQSYLNSSNASLFQKISLSVEESAQTCKSTISQSSARWFVERRLRITGSIAYSIFTYYKNKSPNWQKKLSSIYDGNFKGNDATRHGQYAEKLAKVVYAKKFSFFDTGLVVSKHLPFLAISPDGVAFDGDAWRLVEIKSPIKGRNVSAKDSMLFLDYLTIVDVQFFLKKQHAYYGQVQLGLAVLGFEICDFVIYSSYDNSLATICVERDDVFIETFIKTLCAIYFNHVVPFLSTK